jgi:pyruvate dehydrogenase (quinone)
VPTVSDFMLERLSEWGVKRIYGYPGDGINGVMGALDRSDGFEFVQVRHEEMAAFMASAHAKFTDELGVCMATSGPGAIHLLNGLYDAKMDHQPVLAIIGQQARIALGASYQQEVDLVSLFKDVAGAYVHECVVPGQMRQLLDRAVRIALAERTVTCLIVPNDVQELDAVPSPPRAHGSVFTSVGYERARTIPHASELERAASVLNGGEKVAMLVGAGARGATDELLEVAELLGAGLAKALLGKDVVPDDAACCTGSIGLLGTRASWELMQDCDTLVLIGTGFPYAEFLPEEGKARAVQIDIDARMLGARYPLEVGLVGDARETLRALIPLLERKSDRDWRAEVESNIADWRSLMHDRAAEPAHPINPQLLFTELSTRLPDGAIVTSDSGSAANWYARDISLRRGMRGSLSGNLASMGAGVPYAIAAKFAHPDRPVFALMGDGAMQMNGLAELLTVAKYRDRWADQRLYVLVLHNNDLNQVTWEQRVMLGNPKFDASQDLPDFDYAAFAESIGLRGIRVEAPEQVGPAWQQALESDRPVVIDALCDPDVPPLPPHITLEQAKAFTFALAKGDSDAVGISLEALRQTVGGLLPHRS